MEPASCRFVQTDEGLRTASSHTQAAGDVTGGPGCVRVAASAGHAAAQNALQTLHARGMIYDTGGTVDLTAVPRVTVTSPQVISCGMPAAWRLNNRSMCRCGIVTKITRADAA